MHTSAVGKASHNDERVGLVVLAAGTGTRMRSRSPNRCIPSPGFPWSSACYAPAMAHVRTLASLSSAPKLPIWPSGSHAADEIVTVIQDPPRGTGDAVYLPGRLPASTGRCSLQRSPAARTAYRGEAARRSSRFRRHGHVLSATFSDAAGYGRVVRDDDGRPVGIVERSDDDPARRSGPTEINSGMMAIDAGWAREALDGSSPSDATGELYLTDLVAIAVPRPNTRSRGPSPPSPANLTTLSASTTASSSRGPSRAPGSASASGSCARASPCGCRKRSSSTKMWISAPTR